jgi:hypothetical protein
MSKLRKKRKNHFDTMQFVSSRGNTISIMFFLFFIMIVLVFYVVKVDKFMKNINIPIEKENINFNTFPSMVYNVIINGARTKDDILAIDKTNDYAQNMWINFKEDCIAKRINFIITLGKPYEVKFVNEDKLYVYFKIVPKCDVLHLPNCQDTPLANRMTHFSHILGLNI